MMEMKSHAEYMREWRAKNPQKVKESNHRYYINHKEELKEKRREYKRIWMREWRRKNKEHLREYRRQYYLKNREKILERNRKWRQKNSQKLKEIREKRKMRDRERAFLYGTNGGEKGGFLRGDGICLICFENNPLCLERHHISKDTTITVCSNCHSLIHKGALSFFRIEFIR